MLEQRGKSLSALVIDALLLLRRLVSWNCQKGVSDMVDEIMQEVYETRQRISSAYGNNVSLCVEGLKSMRAAARELGMSLAEYCLKYRTTSAVAKYTH